MSGKWHLPFVFLFISPAFCAPGKTGFDSLRLSQNAAAAGMGEAQTAFVEGVGAMSFNPAGLGQLTFYEAMVTHADYLEGVSLQSIGLGVPFKKGRGGVFGLFAAQQRIENIQARDATAALLGTVAQKDSHLQLSYGFHVAGHPMTFERGGLYLGASVKRVSEELAGVSAVTQAVDVGIQVRPGSRVNHVLGEWTRRFSFGVSLLNLGREVPFDQESTPLPRMTKIGLGYTHFLWGDAFNLAFDRSFSSDRTKRYSTGAELWFRNRVALRMGYGTGHDTGSGIRTGLGFRFQTLQLDYAWAGFGDVFGSTHRFSLTFRMGERAAAVQPGLKTDIIRFHLRSAQDALSAETYHEAVIHASRILDIDPHHPEALHILTEAGEKMSSQDPLPAPLKIESQNNP